MFGDSGKKEQFCTGSVRDSREGKGRLDLIPPEIILSLGKYYEEGAKRYGDRNWEKGQPISRYVDSLYRHMCKFWAGHFDEPHMLGVLWNAIALMETQERIAIGELPKELDDHPAKTNNGVPTLVRVFKGTAIPQEDSWNKCWLWEGTDNGNGYGVISIRGKKRYVHRIICEESHGPPPFEGAVVAHSCDVPNCVNPRHLRWATDEENSVEARAKGRARCSLTKEAQEFLQKSDMPVELLAKMFGITPTYVEAFRNIDRAKT